MVNLTKKAITDSFMKLLNEHPFDKITVKDIVEDCGINRNTFYYHYHDIYELLEEILEAERKRAAEDSVNYESWQEAILQASSFAFENKRALYHVYNSLNRKQIEDYIRDITDLGIRTFVTYKAKDRRISEESMDLIVAFYKSTVVGLILQWLDGNMKKDAEATILQLGTLAEGTMEVMLQNAENAFLGK